jgi:hypothetical protein
MPCADLAVTVQAYDPGRSVIFGKSPHVYPGRGSWPTVVLAGGVLLSLAANLAQAQPTAWGQFVAAVPPAAFLVAVSMIERRAAAEHQDRHGQPITRDALRALLGVSNQAASELLRQLRTGEGLSPRASRAA